MVNRKSKLQSQLCTIYTVSAVVVIVDFVRGVKDSILTRLHLLHIHLEEQKAHAKILFEDWCYSLSYEFLYL